MNTFTFIGMLILLLDGLIVSIGLYVASTMNKWFDLQLTIPIIILLFGLMLIAIGGFEHEEFPEKRSL